MVAVKYRAKPKEYLKDAALLMSHLGAINKS